MKTPALLVLIAVMVAVAGTGRDVVAQEHGQESLRGLPGVHVLVEYMQPEAEPHGLPRSRVQTDVELRLRRAGIRVLTRDEIRVIPGNPYLYININTVPAAGLVVYHIDVALKQSVSLARDLDIEVIGAMTWSNSSTGYVSERQLHLVREYLGDLVDQFINAYYAANPERTPVQGPKPGPAPAPRKEKRR